MKLISNWRKGWRMFSVQAQGAALALLGTWQVFPEDLKAGLPPHLVAWVAMGLLIFGIIGRLIEQPKVNP